MPSEASRRLRATFVNDGVAEAAPITDQRRAWEEAAAQVVLPPGTTITAWATDGVTCELVVSATATQDNLIIWLHGGGFSAGSCITHRDLAARLSAATGCAVLLADYRLAPEYPFPAGLDDAIRVYRAVLRAGYGPHQVIVGGDSAGGGLAISTLLALRERAEPQPAAAVLLSPWADLAMTGASMTTRATLDPMTSYQGLAAAAHLYAGARDPRDPLLSPVYADLHGLAPMLIQVGDHEVLLSDATRLADGIQATGGEVHLDIWPEMWHVFQSFAADLPEAQEAIERIGVFARLRLSSR